MNILNTSRSLISALSLGLLALLSSPVHAADIGVSIGISQPGVYGRIDIGRYPQPELIVAQPVIVHRVERYRQHEPVYLWVPPGHQKNWRKHCYRYGACGVPVVFVRDRWYQDHVMHEHRGGRHGHRDHDRRHRHDRHDRHDHRDDDRDHRGGGRH